VPAHSRLLACLSSVVHRKADLLLLYLYLYLSL